MRRARALVVAVAATLLGVPAPAAASGGVTGDLDRILTGAALAGATVAVDVRDAAGAAVYQRNSGLRVLPASNQKLLTAAAALEVLGPGYRFRTTVRARGGDLHLRGQGDPTLTVARFDGLAADVARGRKRFTGRLVVDDTWFDRVPLGLDWSWQDESFGWTAPVSALTFAADERSDTGAVEIRYRGTGGRRPSVTVWPPTRSVRVVNRAVTGRGDSVSAVRVHGGRTVTVTGSVAPGRSGTVLVSVPDPAVTAAGVFRAALRRHGVTVAGGTVRGPVPGTARILATRVSAPLREILRPFLKLSHNGIAETLVKAMGRAATPGEPGSWPTGLAAATAALGRLGVDTRLLTMGDGSGLSRRNWVTARQLTTLLTAARRRPWFPAFRAALPVAGAADPLVGGTLRHRMRGTAAAGNVRAKTGTLTGVNALSGYVTTRDGRHLTFAALINGALTSAGPTLDRVAVALAESTGPPREAAPAHHRTGNRVEHRARIP